jgi:hypothetical protein
MPNKKPLKVKNPFDLKLTDNRGPSRKDNYYMTSVGGKQIKKPTYKSAGGKIGDGNYKSCGANIIRTK